jgi:hypothetical protein
MIVQSLLDLGVTWTPAGQAANSIVQISGFSIGR